MKQTIRACLATAKLCLKEQSYFGFATISVMVVDVQLYGNLLSM